MGLITMTIYYRCCVINHEQYENDYLHYYFKSIYKARLFACELVNNNGIMDDVKYNIKIRR